jgi:iron(III) transport system ATP-binding protein
MIKVAGLKKTFSVDRGQVRAVDHISFEVAKGAFFTLLGPSGCGKSTTLRCVAGLEKPEEGDIWIDDQPVFSSRDGLFVPPNKRNIAMVYQSYAIWPHMNVFDNVAFPLQIRRKRSAREIREKVGEVLSLVGLDGLQNRPATLLSGGQQQRVALARALVQEPGALLMDEPLSNLDAKLREQMRIELGELLRRLNVTTLYVTHDQLEAFSMSHTIAVMHDGNIIQTGAPREIYNHPKTSFVANFVGLANFLEGKVVDGAGGDGLGRVETPVGILSSRLPGEAKPGDSVTISVRPENIEVCSQHQRAEDNVISGKVQSLIFLGELCDGKVAVQNHVLRIRIHPSTDLNEGQRITLRLPPRACSVLAFH